MGREGKGAWPDLLEELTDATNFSAFFAGTPASKSTPVHVESEFGYLGSGRLHFRLMAAESSLIVSGSDDKSVRVWGNLNVDAPWVVKDCGWIISGAERLGHQLFVHNTSLNGSTTISFAQC